MLGGGTAFAYPYLETAYSPKAQVLAALQTAGEESKQGMQTMISEVSDLLTGQTQLTGNVTFTRAELDGKDYLKEHGLSKGTFKLQLIPFKKKIHFFIFTIIVPVNIFHKHIPVFGYMSVTVIFC